ncbi:MAG: hypothetical protein EBS68_14550 [Rhodobacteraceae bacterium]|nr:hypothetical protein [Paracoccaceae bacterium]
MTPEAIKAKLELIDQIEKVRNNNNVNWMNLLRIAIQSNPEDTMKVIREINTRDNEISTLFAKLGE